jgi:hypothetical protein
MARPVCGPQPAAAKLRPMRTRAGCAPPRTRRRGDPRHDSRASAERLSHANSPRPLPRVAVDSKPDRAWRALLQCRLLNVDDRGTEHADSDSAATSGAYTPNFLEDIAWCDRGARVALDTKGSISAPMARTMVAILSEALVENRVRGNDVAGFALDALGIIFIWSAFKMRRG